MAMNLRDAAKKETTLSTVMENRERMSTKDVINEEISLNEFDFITKEDGTVYTVCSFKEYPNKFLFGGTVITKMMQALATKFGFEAIRAELEVNPLRMRLVTKKSSSGNNYTAVEIV